MKTASRFATLFLCLFILAGILPAEPVIRLKKRLYAPPADLEAYLPVPIRSRNSAGRTHFLIQYPTPPTQAQIGELKRRGVTVVNYVPDSAMIVSERGRKPPGRDSASVMPDACG